MQDYRQDSCSSTDSKGETMKSMAKSLKMTMQEIVEIRDTFQAFDKDKDGRISKDELREVLRSSGQSISDKDVNRIMDDLDENKSGKIEFREFLKSYAGERITEVKEHEEMRQAFNAFDRDGDGLITKMEIREVMSALGEPVTEHQLKKMIRQADVDGNGCIDFEEFSRVCLNK